MRETCCTILPARPGQRYGIHWCKWDGHKVLGERVAPGCAPTSETGLSETRERLIRTADGLYVLDTFVWNDQTRNRSILRRQLASSTDLATWQLALIQPPGSRRRADSAIDVQPLAPDRAVLFLDPLAREHP
jgi:hypothetical protein